MRKIFLSLLATLVVLYVPAQELPPVFVDQLVSDDWDQITGLTFAEDGRMYAWEKAGRLWVVEDDEKSDQPVIDISAEVGNWGDHGLTGVVLHPNFLNNGLFYLLYSVERHHLLYFGTPDYDPGISLTNQASIGRLTRYTADPATNFTSTIPNSRKVLIGEDISSGIPLLHVSHGVGHLAFGTDGTLLISVGDGGSPGGIDSGGDAAGAFGVQALDDGIISPKEDIGSFRAQLIDCLNGKMLRIDPNTGEGLPSNPWFDATNPRAPRSRVWALGLRNSYRFTVEPETGSHNPADGNPGVIVTGDVGWGFWEEINVITEGGQNFGWPIYEGMLGRYPYTVTYINNQDAANPLFNGGNCDKEFFYFQDLIGQPHESDPLILANRCDRNQVIPQSIPQFVHQRPWLTWANRDGQNMEEGVYTAGFDADGAAARISVEAANTPVVSDTFSGTCAIGGVFYEGDNFPEEYQGDYFAIDYSGWIKRFELNDERELVAIHPFLDGNQKIAHMSMNPNDGCVYYIQYEDVSSIRKICYGGNAAPTAHIAVDVQYGPSPLTVQFDGSGSVDPENA
ncbi:MAG: PQQ-dependent sugar dehydrogenase, partial [Bacteroidota bacterium]